MAIIKELFSAYQKSELPEKDGFIVSAFFDTNTNYTKYEVISYNNVKDIYLNEEGLTFQADGRKIFVVVEPPNYSNKHIEPAYRDAMHKIPYRGKEIDIYVSKRQDRVMMGKEPVMTYTSFTVLKGEGHSFSYVLYPSDDLLDAVREFFAKSLWKDAGIPQSDAKKVTESIIEKFKRIAVPLGQEE